MELNSNKFQRVLARDNFQTFAVCRWSETQKPTSLDLCFVPLSFPCSSYPLSLSLRASLRPKSFFRVSVFTHIAIKTNYYKKISWLDSLWKIDWRELGNWQLRISTIASTHFYSIPPVSNICKSSSSWAVENPIGSDLLINVISSLGVDADEFHGLS